MSKIDDGGPAFPKPASHSVHGDYEASEFGMSLRDWFAGQYLAGNRWTIGDADELATDAYRAADAMLKARKP